MQQDAVIDVAEVAAMCQGDCESICSPDSSIKERRQKEKEERFSLVLWRRPVTTLQYFFLETLIKLKELTFE